MDKEVAVLFARKRSVYHRFSQCDVWCEERDATSYCGSLPVIAHPPCRAWGRLRHFAKPKDHELDLARFAVQQVRRCGGVLEHPAGSLLWSDMGLPIKGRDAFGGRTLKIMQGDFGHPAPKATWLYLVNCQIPPLPMPRVAYGRVENLSRAAREATPLELAAWLIQAASSSRAHPLIFYALTDTNGGSDVH